MTKGCIIENNTDIKENHVHFSNKRCLISQKLISNSNSLSKSNTVHCRAKKKNRINNINNVTTATLNIRSVVLKFDELEVIIEKS